MMEHAVENVVIKTEDTSSQDYTSTMDQGAENDDARTDDSSPKEFTRHCEYFHMVIRPMLTPGHEGELCEWMKEMGLLRRTWRCTNEDCKGVNGYMTWNKARVVDKYNWACPNCSKKLSIREGSFFIHIKCELKQIFQAILCWCEQTPVAQASATLGIKDHVVKRIYDRCSEVASKYVEDHNHAWLLGGDNAVVVIDIFPDGYMTSNPAIIDCANKKNTKKVLCIADTSQMPARIWARILEQEHQGVVDEALMYVTQQIRPGSTLVANERAHACPYSAICQLKGYPSIISVETLMELDLPGTRRVQENLGACALLCCGRPFAPGPEGLQAAGLQEAGKRPPGSPRGRRPRAASSHSGGMALCLGVSPSSAMSRAGRLPLALTAAAAAALLAAAALAAPASLLDAPSDAAAPQDCDKEETVYDQRQNGSENYRVHVDGVVVAVVPAEVLVPLVMGAGGEDLEHQLEELLASAAAASASGGGGSYKPEASHTKPPAKPTPAPSTPQITTAADSAATSKQPAVAADKPNKGKLRLSHLLMPLLRRL